MFRLIQGFGPSMVIYSHWLQCQSGNLKLSKLCIEQSLVEKPNTKILLKGVQDVIRNSDLQQSNCKYCANNNGSYNYIAKKEPIPRKGRIRGV